MVAAAVDDEVRAYYDRGGEAARLTRGAGLLELARTKELIQRHLPSGDLDILDVGGGPGAYAAWLSDLGHRVTLIDPVPLHLAQAPADITSKIGDARSLPAEDGSADAVLLLGPLYHLTSRADRVQALTEARRCLRPGGLVFAAVIARYAALMDLSIRLGRFHEEGVAGVVAHALETGIFDGHRHGLFTTAYFHHPAEAITEAQDAQLPEPRLFNIEGPGAFAPDVDERWRDPAGRQGLLDAARLVEEDLQLMVAGSHLLLVARKPDL